MHKSFVFGRSFFWITFCALSAMTAGIFCSDPVDLQPFLQMRLASGPVSIVVRLLAVLLPFLISAYAVSIKQWNILLITVFLRFFTWGYFAGMCIRFFGSAAWLVQPMLQFTDNGSLILFTLYCFRGETVSSRVFWFLVIAAAFIVITDYSIVMPILASLLTF